MVALAFDAHADVPISAHPDRVTIAPMRRAVHSGYERYHLAASVPPAPYEHTHPGETLPGFVNTPPLVTDDGGLVVGLASPPGIAFVAPDGRVRASARLDERPTGDLALGADGRVFATGDGRTVFVIAPDGSVRNTLTTTGSTSFNPGAFGRSDGTVVLVENGVNSTVAWLSPQGERLGSASVGSRVASAALGLDGCFWVASSGGVSCVDSNGVRHEMPFGRGAIGVTSVTEHAIAVLLPAELQLRDPRGALRGRLAVNSPIQWLVPLATGGVAMLRTVPAQELQILGPDASTIGHAPFNVGIGVRVLGVLADESGAMIAATSEGLVIALESDGAERWRLDTRRRFARAPVPLPHGGFVIPLAEGGLFFVE